MQGWAVVNAKPRSATPTITDRNLKDDSGGICDKAMVEVDGLKAMLKSEYHSGDAYRERIAYTIGTYCGLNVNRVQLMQTPDALVDSYLEDWSKWASVHYWEEMFESAEVAIGGFRQRSERSEHKRYSIGWGTTPESGWPYRWTAHCTYSEMDRAREAVTCSLQDADNEKLREQAFAMVIFDWIIGNPDRHSGNWGFVGEDLYLIDHGHSTPDSGYIDSTPPTRSLDSYEVEQMLEDLCGNTDSLAYKVATRFCEMSHTQMMELTRCPRDYPDGRLMRADVMRRFKAMQTKLSNYL